MLDSQNRSNLTYGKRQILIADDEIVNREILGAILEKIAEFRQCLKKGGAFDTDKAASIVIDDFRKGLFGKLTLDEVPEKDS